jgi:CRP-like cAMP-binding protein
VIGLAGAMAIHLIYNNIVVRLEGTDLLLVAFSIGIGGSAVIAYLISWGLTEEKEHFDQSLRLSTGISGAELRAVQRLGGMEVEGILKELATYFGADKARRIRHLLIQEANLGILRNNLNGNASDRLRKAWSAEIDTLRAEIDTIRDELGVYVMMYLRSLLPDAESIVWADVDERFAAAAPEKVHSFDLFMVASKMAETVSPEQLETTSAMLGKIKIFAGVPEVDLDNLSRAISARNFETSEILFKQGDPGDAMYLIEEGHVEISDDISGKRLRTMSIGEVVGVLTIIDGLPRSASARALTPVKAWQLRRQHFLMFVQSRPHVSLAILRVLADDWRAANERILREASGESNVTTMTRLGEALKMLGSIADREMVARISREIGAESLGTG